MPLPTPNTDESHDDFITRCMSDDEAQREFPDNDQRLAVCETQWSTNDMDKNYGPISIKAQGQHAEILIYEEIGADFWGDGLSAKNFVEDLRSLGELETINARINSPGGDVFDGVAIYRALTDHAATVEIDIDGMALSIASVIAMSGDEIRMGENAMFMIHDPWTFSLGNASELRETADLLDKIGGTLRDTYAKRSGTDAEQIADWMRDETWFTAAEAQDAGLVDTISESKAIAAKYDLSKFKHVPKAWVESLEPEKQPPEPSPSERTQPNETRNSRKRLEASRRRLAALRAGIQ